MRPDSVSTDIDGLLAVCGQAQEIDLTVVGPEVALLAGIVDAFEQSGLRIFGPARESCPAGRLQSLCQRADAALWHIPTGRFAVVFVSFGGRPITPGRIWGAKPRNAPLVVKADGEAAGKGVSYLPRGKRRRRNALRRLYHGESKVFGASGETVVIEEFLEGQEASLMAFTDGVTRCVPMLACPRP